MANPLGPKFRSSYATDILIKINVSTHFFLLQQIEKVLNTSFLKKVTKLGTGNTI